MKKMKKLLISLLLVSCINVPLFSHAAVSTGSTVVTQAVGSQISPLKDDIRWVYTIMDGKLYRRLYNTSTGRWIGDWELVP